jgi:type II secretory pathway pseudopilin PulG
MVVMLIGIFTAVAIPQFVDSLLFYRVESAARRVKIDLELARRAARLTSSQQSVTFDNSRYELSSGVAGLDKPNADYAVDLAAAPFHLTTVSVDFGGDAAVSFDGFGTPSSGGTVLLGTAEHECTVTLDGTTGDVRITRNHARMRSPE